MESKLLKTDVCFNKNIFSEVLEQPIDVDFTLPDYCPDISKIFKCRAVPMITSKSMNGKSITIDGNVCITLLYCDKNNKLCSYEYIYPFSKIKEMPEESDDCNLSCAAKCDYINCRAITGRKVDIHGAVSLKVKAFKRCSNQIVSDYDEENLELKRSLAPATVPIGYREKYLIVEEEISIGNSNAPVLQILRYDAAPYINECKVLNEKIVVKGEMAVSVLYSAEGVAVPQLIKTTLPFSQIVEMAGVTELCKCDVKAKIAFLEVRPANSLGGECRSLTFNAKVCLLCESYCVNEIAVIEDAFSTKYQTALTQNQVRFNKICQNVKENCLFKRNVELMEDISSVIDIWCEKGSPKVTLANGNINLSALLLVGIIACDQNDNVSFYEKPLEFEFNYPLNCDSDSLYFNPDIEILSIGYTILSANTLEIRIEVCVMGAVYEKSDISLITDIKIDTTKPCVKAKKGGAVICFLNKDETIWEIAKKYNASTEEIAKINGIEKESLKDKKIILVPIN